MYNQIALLMNKSWVIVQQDKPEFYEDTYENFVLDYGKKPTYETIDYNKNSKTCVLNGEPQIIFENKECEDIIYSLDMLLANKRKREYIPPTLEEVKNNKITELKSARDEAEQQPVETNKGIFDVDDKSLQRINGAIAVLSISHGAINWTLADNTVVDVNEEDLRNVIVVLAMQSNAVHEKYRTLKERVEACTTVEQVDKIKW